MARFKKNDCTIDDMEMLLNQLSEFENIIRSGARMSDPALRQEVQMFQQFILWRIQDIDQANLKDWDREIIGLRDQQHPS